MARMTTMSVVCVLLLLVQTVVVQGNCYSGPAIMDVLVLQQDRNQIALRMQHAAPPELSGSVRLHHRLMCEEGARVAGGSSQPLQTHYLYETRPH
ncbi:hypothetical protein C0Q70_17463 [Pomacea canaliculata]|uniref:Uncharacterized protein n=1 Tax=Pomacea canaliculata TaxID=400727 RepID=A0A2T7NKG9_POMCA|nr:hypothetical protein C0Q70_17463 [Pomacea canaliculata]